MMNRCSLQHPLHERYMTWVLKFACQLAGAIFHSIQSGAFVFTQLRTENRCTLLLELL